MSDLLSDFTTFLKCSPTSWHAVKEMGTRLALSDFTPLNLQDPWKLELGKPYFVHKAGSCLAFILPEKKPQNIRLLAAHTDSPALKLKPNPLFSVENMVMCGVETYGSPLLTSWLNRDLCLSGRVVVSSKQGNQEERYVHLDDALLVIPQLALHLDRDIHEKGLLLNKQEHLCPILGLGPEGVSLEKLLRRHLHFETLLSFDLFLVPVEEPKFLGFSGEFLASYRLDNLTSVHAALAALSSELDPADSTLKMIYCADHEEIGSGTVDGAASPFLMDVLSRLQAQLNISVEEFIQMKERSLCVSIDMAHGLNPNYVNRHDPKHQPLLRHGIVLKHNANQKYASDALSSAVIAQACKELKISYQNFVCRSDIPCGSTIGPVLAKKTGMATVDIGCAQLSMHSIREVIACQDYCDLYLLLKHLLNND